MNEQPQGKPLPHEDPNLTFADLGIFNRRDARARGFRNVQRPAAMAIPKKRRKRR